jgi:hypothetical protein
MCCFSFGYGFSGTKENASQEDARQAISEKRSVTHICFKIELMSILQYLMLMIYLVFYALYLLFYASIMKGHSRANRLRWKKDFAFQW